MVQPSPCRNVSLAVFSILLLAVPAPSADPSDAPPAPPQTKTETDVEADCSRCKSTGRISCPTCKGAGNIHKTCPLCKGKGRRPCPQCASGLVPGGNGSAAPGQSNRGRISCTSCSGRGTLENNPDRPCSRCRGSRDQICPTCTGRGDLSCPKTRYVGTCSTCAFVGRVACPSCQEGSPVDDLPASASESNGGAAVNDDRRPAKSGPKSKSRTTDEEDPSPGPSLQQEPYTEARFLSDQKSLVGKWEVLGKDMETVQTLFATGTIEKIRKTKSEFLRLAREADSLAESGNAAAREIARRSRDGIKRIDPLETAWSRLDSRYERLQFQFKSARNLWESQPRWSLDLPQGDQEAAQDKLAFLGQAIDLTSKSASRLRDEKPEKTSQGIGEAETAASQLRREIDKAREVSRRAAPGGAGSVAKPTGSAGRSPSEGTEEARLASVPAPAPSNGQHREAPKKSAESAENAEQALHPEKDVQDEPARQEDGAPENAGGSWTVVAVLCTLLAATMCALVYVLTDRRNGSRDRK